MIDGVRRGVSQLVADDEFLLQVPSRHLRLNPSLRSLRAVEINTA